MRPLQARVFPENWAGVALHLRFVFTTMGTLEKIAWMSHGPIANQWRDTVIFQRLSMLLGVDGLPPRRDSLVHNDPRCLASPNAVAGRRHLGPDRLGNTVIGKCMRAIRGGNDDGVASIRSLADVHV